MLSSCNSGASWLTHRGKLSLGSGISSPKEKTACCNSTEGERIKIIRTRTKQFRTKNKPTKFSTPVTKISFFSSGIICLISFLIALCFTLGSGSYWIDIFDRYAGSVPLLVIAFFEVIGVAYIYKIQRYVGKLWNFFSLKT